MEKEPWKEDIYENGEKNLTRTKKFDGVWANRVLTILAVIFFILVISTIAFLAYLSIGGSNTKTAMQGFNSGNSSEVTTSSASSTEASETENAEGTLTVLAGEGEAAIAARAGISIAELEALNPSHMSTGSWYANPGDVVKIQ